MYVVNEREEKKRRKKKKSLMGWGVGRPVCVSPTVDQSTVDGLPQPKTFHLQRDFPQMPMCT